MNAADIKIGKRAKVSMMTQPHPNVKQGDEVVIVGVPIVLCKLPNGKLERFYCHELEEAKKTEKGKEE